MKKLPADGKSGLSHRIGKLDADWVFPFAGWPQPLTDKAMNRMGCLRF